MLVHRAGCITELEFDLTSQHTKDIVSKLRGEPGRTIGLVDGSLWSVEGSGIAKSAFSVCRNCFGQDVAMVAAACVVPQRQQLWQPLCATRLLLGLELVAGIEKLSAQQDYQLGGRYFFAAMDGQRGQKSASGSAVAAAPAFPWRGSTAAWEDWCLPF